MEIRPIREYEFKDLQQIYTRAFFMSRERLDMYPFIKEGVDLSRTRALLINNNILSALQIIPFNCWFNQKRIPMGGIAAVVTSPEHRNHGYVHTLLKYAVKEMKEQGFAISILFARLQSIYNKFGWEMASNSKEYCFHPDTIGTIPQVKGQMLLSSKGDLKTLNSIYNKFAHTKVCMLVRDSEYWNNVILDRKYIYIWKNSRGIAEGYLIYQIINDGMERGHSRFKMDIKELVTLTHESRAGIFTFFKSLLPQIQKIVFRAPVDDLSLNYFSNKDIEINIVRGFMLRIVDIKKAFESKQYRSELKGEVAFEIIDNMAPWNHGVFSLSVENGTAKISSSKKQQLFSCSINTISQIYSGYLDLIPAHNIGKLHCSNTSELAKVNKLFSESTPYMNDFF